MLWISAILVGLVFGLITGGNITRLAKLKFRWPWLVLVAIVIREAILLSPLNTVEGAQYLYLVALAAIVAWIVWHVGRVRGIWLIGLGAALNLVVITVNGGRMPVSPDAAGPLITHGSLGQYTLMGDGTKLNFLADWIRLYPLSQAYSLGDILIAIGLAVVVFLAVRNPNAYSELTPP